LTGAPVAIHHVEASMIQTAQATSVSNPDVATLRQSILWHLRYSLSKDQYTATPRDFYHSLAYALRDLLTDDWIKTQQHYYNVDAKRIYYLSAEFLIGRLIDNVLINRKVEGTCRQALKELGLNLDELVEMEWDAGLGTGGLGRLAACFLDSMATLGLAAHGYGIRYEFGIFSQKIERGYQVETPDNWLRYTYPWEIARPEMLFPVHYYGQVHQRVNGEGKLHHDWVNTEIVMAMAHDLPIPGYGNGVVNNFRLWAAKSSREFNLDYFNHGDYIRAVEEKNRNENISRVLYPPDDFAGGRELRLKQEYFLVSATLQDILRRYKKQHASFEPFPDKVAIQLNDTHPCLAIPELMRLLVDREGLEWGEAWEIARATFGYTNHTIMPEALERWPVSMLERVLPRHMQIIYEINRRFLDVVRYRYPGDSERVRRMSIIQEGDDKQVRMANLALVGCHAINGVSALHSGLLRKEVFREFHEFGEIRFSNKTNGITPRLWLARANPELSALITRRIGNSWITHLDRLDALVPLADDRAFRSEWAAVKRQNKERLAAMIKHTHAALVDEESLFDCHVKRIHEYKRQLLNVLHVITLYNRLKDDPNRPSVPRTVLFGGKAAPGYARAKLIIKLINSVAEVVNHDPDVADRLAVYFLPNYRVSTAQKIIPAADLSEQISTAGTEASGTGNMKFALNGALTIGTLDGANIEIMEAVGEENIFIFGLKADQVSQLKHAGYNPWDFYQTQPELRRCLNMIRDGYFSKSEPQLFQPLFEALLNGGDNYLVLADYEAFINCQDRVAELYRDSDAWTRKSILNVARVGRFSSDRTIQEYARDIWGAETVPGET
jgi:starch phosphorylase